MRDSQHSLPNPIATQPNASSKTNKSIKVKASSHPLQVTSVKLSLAENCITIFKLNTKKIP